MAKPLRDPSFSGTKIPSPALDSPRKCSKSDCKKVGLKGLGSGRMYKFHEGAPLVKPSRIKDIESADQPDTAG